MAEKLIQGDVQGARVAVECGLPWKFYEKVIVPCYANYTISLFTVRSMGRSHAENLGQANYAQCDRWCGHRSDTQQTGPSTGKRILASATDRDRASRETADAHLARPNDLDHAGQSAEDLESDLAHREAGDGAAMAS